MYILLLNKIISLNLYFLKVLPIILCALLSDQLPVKSRFAKAVLDNIVGHACISFFVWLAILDFNVKNKQHGLELVLSFVVGSMIDMDHFIMAKSLNLKVCNLTLILIIY